MSIDVLRNKVRKTKNPTVVYFEADPSLVPPDIMEKAENTAAALDTFYRQIMTALKGSVPAVRFSFGSFSLLGGAGTDVLIGLVKKAKDLGFYVFLDLPEILTTTAVELTIRALENIPCHAVITSAYLGGDVVRPLCELNKKGIAVFVVSRTSNKTAGEMQDLLTLGRHVHTAAVDVANRCAHTTAKSGYSMLGAVAAASSADNLRILRSKYREMYLLVDGFDYSNLYAKNVIYAFDSLGHGGVVCVSRSVLGAWKEGRAEDTDAVEAAVHAITRVAHTLAKYVTVI
jgi:orotidine-5'-phosphate decarboxylase